MQSCQVPPLIHARSFSGRTRCVVQSELVLGRHPRFRAVAPHTRQLDVHELRHDLGGDVFGKIVAVEEEELELHRVDTQFGEAAEIIHDLVGAAAEVRAGVELLHGGVLRKHRIDAATGLRDELVRWSQQAEDVHGAADGGGVATDGLAGVGEDSVLVGEVAQGEIDRVPLVEVPRDQWDRATGAVTADDEGRVARGGLGLAVGTIELVVGPQNSDRP